MSQVQNEPFSQLNLGRRLIFLLSSIVVSGAIGVSEHRSVFHGEDELEGELGSVGKKLSHMLFNLRRVWSKENGGPMEPRSSSHGKDACAIST